MNLRKAIFFLFLFLNLFYGFKGIVDGTYLLALLNFAVAYAMTYFTYGTIGSMVSDLKQSLARLFK